MPFILNYPDQYAVRNVTDENLRPYIKFILDDEEIFNLTWGTALTQVVPPGWKRLEQVPVETPRGTSNCIIAKPRALLLFLLSRERGYLTGAFLLDRVEYVFTFREEYLSDFKNMLKDRVQFRPMAIEPSREEIRALISKVNKLIEDVKSAQFPALTDQIMRDLQIPIRELGKAGDAQGAACLANALKVTVMSYVDSGIASALDVSNTTLGALVDIGDEATPYIQAGTMDSRRGVRNWFKRALKLIHGRR